MVGVGAVTAAGVKGSLRRPSAALDPGSRGSGNATCCATPPETVTERHMLRLGTPPITTPPLPAPQTPRALAGPDRDPRKWQEGPHVAGPDPRTTAPRSAATFSTIRRRGVGPGGGATPRSRGAVSPASCTAWGTMVLPPRFVSLGRPRRPRPASAGLLRTARLRRQPAVSGLRSTG